LDRGGPPPLSPARGLHPFGVKAVCDRLRAKAKLSQLLDPGVEGRIELGKARTALPLPTGVARLLVASKLLQYPDQLWVGGGVEGGICAEELGTGLLQPFN